MVVVPLETAVTTPLEDTVATDVLDEVHVDELVTSCAAPDTVAVAVNCAVAPTAGAVPVTLTAETELGSVGESPQATAEMARTRATAETIDRIDIQTPQWQVVLACLIGPTKCGMNVGRVRKNYVIVCVSGMSFALQW